jgi:hypothetical protein
VKYAVIPQIYTIIAFGASLASLLFMRALRLLIRIDSSMAMDGTPTYLAHPYFTLNFSLWLTTTIVWFIAFMLSLRYIRKNELKLTEVITQNLHVTVFAAFTVIIALCGCLGFSNTYHSVPPGTILPLLSPLTLGTRTVAYFGTLCCVPVWIGVVLWEQLRPRWTCARRKAVISLILLAFSVFAYYLGITVVAITPPSRWPFPRLLYVDRSSMIECIPASVLAIAGLAFCVAWRRELKKRSIKHPNRITPSACIILGVVLLLHGAFAFLGGFVRAAYMSGASLIYMLNIASPFLLLSVFWLISGIILMGDGWRNLKASARARRLAAILLFLIAVVSLWVFPWGIWFYIHLFVLYLARRLAISRKFMSVKLWILAAILFFLIVLVIPRVATWTMWGLWVTWFILPPLFLFLAGLLAFSFSAVVRKILFYLEDRKHKTKKT